MKLSNIENGKTFKIGNTEFIKFSEENGGVTAVTKDIVFKSKFGNNNRLSESTVLKRLETEWLPKIAELVGKDNIIEFETDLLALDGSTNDKMKSKVSLVTLDFYRLNRKIFDAYRIMDSWWLATPGYDSYNCCGVHYDGYVNYYYYVNCSYNGVRPALIFKSNISVSE